MNAQDNMMWRQQCRGPAGQRIGRRDCPRRYWRVRRRAGVFTRATNKKGACGCSLRGTPARTSWEYLFA